MYRNGFTSDSSNNLNYCSNFLQKIGMYGRAIRSSIRRKRWRARAVWEATMNRAIRIDEGLNSDSPCTAEAFYALGMQCSVGGDTSDLISAHKWFNLAAMLGSLDAVRLRREIAAQMSSAEIGAAQRAARDYMKQHPAAFAPRPQSLNAAA
jgi:hypothetical protein